MTIESREQDGESGLIKTPVGCDLLVNAAVLQHEKARARQRAKPSVNTAVVVTYLP
jgi:hypothetical protein